MENEEERVGKFSASNISRLLAGGSGATRKTYILELATQVVTGERPPLDTSATRHGIANQMNAFEFVLKPIYKGIQWCDKYIPINDNCGASPDCIFSGDMPIDIKCPYEIDTYLDQTEKLKPSYFSQVQMQILSVNGSEGALCTYLTKPEKWGSDEEWTEYPFPLEDRYHIHKIKKDEEHCDRILKAVEDAAPIRDMFIEKLLNATVMEEDEYFYFQRKHNKCRDIKLCSNIERADIIRVLNNFYYLLK